MKSEDLRRQMVQAARLAIGTALAAHGVAHGKVTDPARLPGSDAANATAEAARVLGRFLLDEGKPAEALAAYRQALAQDPDSVDALNGMAVTFDRLGRFDESRTYYEAALSLDPTSPMLLSNYGLSLWLQGETREAQRFLSLAVASGDPQAQAASLRILARMDAETIRPAMLPEAMEGPQVVRVSGHEQRLVLDDGAVRSPSRFSPEQALAMAAIGDFTPGQMRQIERVETAAIARELASAHHARAMEDARTAEDSLPRFDAELAASAFSGQAGHTVSDATTLFDGADARQSAASPRHTPDWYRDQILLIAPSSNRRERDERRPGSNMALLGAGLKAGPPPRTWAPDTPKPREKRQFAQPFNSDNGRLNQFAQRLNASSEPDVAEQVARLEALIERMQKA